MAVVFAAGEAAHETGRYNELEILPQQEPHSSLESEEARDRARGKEKVHMADLAEDDAVGQARGHGGGRGQGGLGAGLQPAARLFQVAQVLVGGCRPPRLVQRLFCLIRLNVQPRPHVALRVCVWTRETGR